MRLFLTTTSFAVSKDGWRYDGAGTAGGKGAEMSRIGFIGLGIMGAPMAENLARAGHDVTVFNRSRPSVDRLVSAGARGATSVAEAVSGAEVVITMLPDSPDVIEVVRGESGALAHMAEGAILVDMSTIRPDVARDNAEIGGRRGVAVLDAPVSGGEAAAIEGTLSIMVGGDPGAFSAVEPVFGVLGATVVLLGPAGSGQTAKAANQLIVAGTIELVSEALVLLDASGVDLQKAVEVLSGGLAGNAIFTRKAPTMLARDFRPGFRVDLHHKDLSIVLEAIRTAGTSAPLALAVAGLMASLRAQGFGSLDHSALLLQVEELSGRGRPGEGVPVTP
jgi:2-hydroxy-3-oxopropionate reductase